ncbi:MAG: peptidylprolyl isomerase [Candidatus Colwellbacteria bacterium CG10_big_fil_rev_8_21_14_0_10_42_22]|uniref:Peptidyl-prolyl cis-trans isomerase n=1 Tax=Candidatus Colwellbacteria bacterium CG10_big_fil_rev_8_21_14_0_10_42_22 TaxID=1974540 RepID=A0A2H0VI73_9BACT|nr:MAG: peptidylprolyl isomerase [Candidatus Colwellbacteria bacterium CG10_big_fil_rev_8_21_14_0_10_42_22]
MKTKNKLLQNTLIVLLTGALILPLGFLFSPASQVKNTQQQMNNQQELKIEVLREGEGGPVERGETVLVHYTGWLEDGTKFDSSIDRGEPFAFILGAGQVIPGWELGVEGMKIGERRKLIISPELAYGTTGTPGGPIPPNATLVFEVELLDSITANEFSN